MAKYEDYVKRDPATGQFKARGEVEQEIDAAAQAQVQRQQQESQGYEMPERFAGKSAEDIAKSYTELEKLTGRSNDRLGQLEQSLAAATSTINQLSSVQTPSPAEQQDTRPVTVDDLYDDADGNIRRIVREESAGKIEALEKELEQSRTQGQVSQFTGKYPEWQEDARTPEFLNWVQENGYRAKLAQAADNYDFDAADALFGMYYDSKGHTQADDNTNDVERDRQLRDASLESGGPVSGDMTQTYSRSELGEIRIAARQGNRKAIRYLETFGADITAAYGDGRIVD